ncbi:hypothetical protein MIR68_012125 [Amoeboaphelidium protococcarum]|nr:hypothetical protein MIR68_012125 [Amoeboaphelidium protococcarum]
MAPNSKDERHDADPIGEQQWLKMETLTDRSTASLKSNYIVPAGNPRYASTQQQQVVDQFRLQNPTSMLLFTPPGSGRRGGADRFKTEVHVQQAFPSRASEVNVIQGQLIYANKGQSVPITLIDNGGAGNEKVRSLIYVDVAEKEPLDSQEAWTICAQNCEDQTFEPIEMELKQSESTSRLIQFDLKNQFQGDQDDSGRGDPQQVIPKQSSRFIIVEWSAKCEAYVKFNFLSTDFSSNKGVRGVICTLNIVSYTSTYYESSQCSVKVFRDKGADRKYREETARLARNGLGELVNDNSSISLKSLASEQMDERLMEQYLMTLIQKCQIPSRKVTNTGNVRQSECVSLPTPVKEAASFTNIPQLGLQNATEAFQLPELGDDEQILVIRKKQRVSLPMFYLKAAPKASDLQDDRVANILTASDVGFVACLESRLQTVIFTAVYDTTGYQSNQLSKVEFLQDYLADNVLQVRHEISHLLYVDGDIDSVTRVSNHTVETWFRQECCLSVQIILLDNLTVCIVFATC